MQELSLLFVALGLDYIMGDPRTKYHPVCLMGNFAYALEKHLRHGQNTFAMFLRGAVAWLCVATLFSLSAWGMVHVAGILGGMSAEFIICTLILAFCMAPKSLSQHAQDIIRPLQQEDIPTARRKLAMIVGRDVHALDAHGIARASIESISENLVDGVLATLFWACIGFFWGYDMSAALAVLHRVSNVLDAQWGKKNETYIRFGTFSARMDDALNLIPARLSLFCICFTALLQSMYREKSWHITKKTSLFTVAWQYRYAHASPNSAWSEAAFASALDLTLSGPVAYAGKVVNHPPIGQGTTKATVQHMQQALQLLWLTIGLWMGCSALIWYFVSLI